jgi:hypothetical protein
MRVPPSSSTLKKPLYQGDRVERDLLVVIDANTVSGNPDAVGVNDLVFGLSTHDHVKMYLYGDDGPPEGTPMMKTDFWPDAAIGWLVAETDEPDGITSHSLTYSDGKHSTTGGVIRGLMERFAQTLARANGSASSDVFEKDSLLVVAASEIYADILITNRPSLLAARPINTPEPITIATPAEALSLLGLYIRSRGDYLPTKGASFTFQYNKGHYWQDAVLLHVPNLLELTGRAALLDRSRGSSHLQLFSYAALRRLTRVFERRDAIWRLIDQKQDSDIAEDTLAALDSLLMFLMSAADVLAKLADGILGTTTNPINVGWQKPDWRKAITKKDATLGAAFADGTKPTTALKVLRLLRNCIHDEGLDSIAVQPPTRIQETWIVLPRSQATPITEAMKTHAPLTKWGVHDGPDGSRYVEVGALMETLLVEVLSALNVAAARLGKILETLTPAPPPLPKSQVNEALIALHIQWQIGLGEPGPELTKT